MHRGHSAAAEESGDQGGLPGGVFHHHPHQTGHVHECVAHGGEVGLLGLPGVGGRDHEDDGEVTSNFRRTYLLNGALSLPRAIIVTKKKLGRRQMVPPRVGAELQCPCIRALIFVLIKPDASTGT